MNQQLMHRNYLKNKNTSKLIIADIQLENYIGMIMLVQICKFTITF